MGGGGGVLAAANPMVAIGTLAAGGGQVAGAYLGARAQERAANAAAEAERYAADKNASTNLEMYYQTRSDLAPWMRTGKNANLAISDLMGLNGTDAQNKAFGNFRTDPGYQFAFNQGQQAIDRSASANGGLYSGRTGMALSDYGRGMGDQSYGNYFNRLYGISQTGQNSAARIGASGSDAAARIGSGYLTAGQGIANSALYAGNARANMYQDFGNALNSGLNNLYYANRMGYLQ